MEYFARAGYREMGTDGVLKNERENGWWWN